MSGRIENTRGEGLERKLTNRHVQMIAFGGAIGVGLFMGSGGAIHRAGPSLLLAYIPAGLAIFLILRALAEIAVDRPTSGSFASYANEFLGPMSGFITGWTYWFAWLATCMAELDAIGKYIAYWFPSVPHWVSAVAILVLIWGANLLTVRVFGETVVLFTTIKIIAIVGLILLGLAVLLGGLGAFGDKAGIDNLWNHGGVFPNGPIQTLIVLQAVMFAFFGLEMIGISAGEVQNPKKTIPSAVNRVVLTICVFYVGSLLIIMALIPWNELDAHHSPFVTVFDHIGIPAAATVMNFVVLTAALSAGNSGLFSTGRMVFSLAQRNHAPSSLTRVNRRNVPGRAISLSAIGILIGVFVNYIAPDQAFTYHTSLATLGGLWIWGIIIVTHMKYRRAVDRGEEGVSSFRMPLYPWSNYFVLGFLLVVAVLLGFSAETRMALYIAPIWAAVVLGAYWFLVRRPQRAASAIPNLEAAEVRAQQLVVPAPAAAGQDESTQ